jgi:DNA processing protein
MNSPQAPRDDALAWLGLVLVPGLSYTKQRALLAAFETPGAILAASRDAIVRVVGQAAAAHLARGPDRAMVAATLQWLAMPGRRMQVTTDSDYPQALLQIADPPLVLYTEGRAELLDTPCLAIVGSRNATPQGVRDAEAFARELSDAGLCIVSGLALGIDAAAHRGGLAGAASSIAIMGTGPNVLYPKRNGPLAGELAQRGCLVSEFPLGTPPTAANFPRRNRVISGLSRGVVVVEAAMHSGSLNTARSALDQNRDVFAVPGSIHSPLAKGCHSLLKQGAKLVESAHDVLVELRLAAPIEAGESSGDGIVEDDPVLEEMGHAPASVDQLAQRTRLDAAKLAAHLARLEIAGRVRALPGGWFQRVVARVIE